MEIVIKIPEELYKKQLSDDWTGNTYIHDAIINGVVLPKGHGRLIDADDLKFTFQSHHDFFIYAYGNINKVLGNDKVRMDEILQGIAEIVNASTVLDADKDCEDRRSVNYEISD